KIYATGIPMAKWLVVLARTDEPEPRLGYFVVPMDAAGVSIDRSWDTMGMRATRSDDLILQDVRLPLDEAFGLTPATQGLKRDPREFAWYFMMISAVYDGIAQAARDWVVQFAATHVPGPLGKPLATLPRFQEGIGQMDVLLGTSRRLLRSLAEDYDQGRDFGGDALVVKHTVIENAQTVVMQAMELAGNPGISRANPMERHLRDVMGGKIHAPQNSMIRATIGRTVAERAMQHI
ncbi:MAG TPA: acyl-CoA dehydrogenase, partial [Paenirhodobacter sp.]